MVKNKILSFQIKKKKNKQHWYPSISSHLHLQDCSPAIHKYVRQPDSPDSPTQSDYSSCSPLFPRQHPCQYVPTCFYYNIRFISSFSCFCLIVLLFLLSLNLGINVGLCKRIFGCICKMWHMKPTCLAHASSSQSTCIHFPPSKSLIIWDVQVYVS